MDKSRNRLAMLWPKNIHSAIRLNILVAMLGGILFFASDAAVGHLLPYAVSKGLSIVILTYSLASAIILKSKAIGQYYG